MTKDEVRTRCREAVLNRLNAVGIDYESVSDKPCAIKIKNGIWKGQDWSSKIVRIRGSSLKNQGFYPININAYGWVAEGWKRSLDYDLLICACYNNGTVERILVFDVKDISHLPDVHLRWLTSVKRRLQLFQSVNDMEASKAFVNQRKDGKYGTISPWEEEVNRNILKGSKKYDL